MKSDTADPPPRSDHISPDRRRFCNRAAENAFTADELLDRLDVTKPQLSAWLKRGIEEKRLRKLAKPVRYGWKPAAKQPSMFGPGE